MAPLFLEYVMITVFVIFVAMTLVIALISAAWSASNRDEKVFVVKALFKGACYASITATILFVVVNIF